MIINAKKHRKLFESSIYQTLSIHPPQNMLAFMTQFKKRCTIQPFKKKNLSLIPSLSISYISSWWSWLLPLHLRFFFRRTTFTTFLKGFLITFNTIRCLGAKHKKKISNSINIHSTFRPHFNLCRCEEPTCIDLSIECDDGKIIVMTFKVVFRLLERLSNFLEEISL